MNRLSYVASAALLATLGLVAGGARGEPATGSRLEPLPLDPDSVTVSGISAGGYMAVQYHVAHSTRVRGAAILAAGPYGCSRGSIAQALGPCMKGDGTIGVDELVGLTRKAATDGAIDPVADLAADRVWLFHGAADPVVARPVVDALESYYRAFVDPKGLARVETPGAGHTFPGRGSGLAACGTTASPFVADCAFDGARTLLEHLYGPFEGPASAPGELRRFSQQPYARAAGAAGLADEGFLYVPQSCSSPGEDARCRVHVVFHGCKQGASFVDDAFVRQSGYLAAADAGRVVLLFPQVAPSLKPLNPNGCWDWWGYGGADYATRRGGQVAAVDGMVDDLLGVTADR